MKKFILVLTSIFLAGCSVLGIRSASEPDYEVLNDYQHIQIRKYPPLVIVQTEVNEDYKESSSQGFNRLAGYIFGNNKNDQKMTMTAPVFQEQESTRLAMTVPVIEQKNHQIWLMAFVLPQKYSSAATAPKPLDADVLIKEIPSKKVAVIKYSGSLSEQGIEEKSEELKNWLLKKGFKPISNSRSAAYDPPWTLPFLRRNEVHIDIE
jgi:effector-binding domain-containing protein